MSTDQEVPDLKLFPKSTMEAYAALAKNIRVKQKEGIKLNLVRENLRNFIRAIIRKLPLKNTDTLSFELLTNQLYALREQYPHANTELLRNLDWQFVIEFFRKKYQNNPQFSEIITQKIIQLKNA